ncbi:glucose 1-dehydrogenase [Archangium violaceum]|uniref:SDR family NAD(P)-dependent oxidoreductase n=1 Tax=Archangium violaceum TaxID=83451 RepID=UPI002B2F9834|nr:glucose 1-dehydrogenase [Archangium violaceum]
MARLDGKVALVVGGSGGIGRATALTLAQAGARVVVAARRVTEGSAVVQEILGQGGTARFVETDITQSSHMTRAVESTVAAFGRLDCAVNVPGTTGQPSTIADCTDDNWDQVLHLNLTAFFWCLRAELRQMRAQGGGGRIVNVSSAIGKRAFRRLGAYGATKRALESLTETAALEVASEGITVNAVAPGSIETETFIDFTQGDAATQRMMAETYHPLARIGQPDEVARAILYLCADATFTTGTTLPVDGGWIFRS